MSRDILEKIRSTKSQSGSILVKNLPFKYRLSETSHEEIVKAIQEKSDESWECFLAEIRYRDDQERGKSTRIVVEWIKQTRNMWYYPSCDTSFNRTVIVERRSEKCPRAGALRNPDYVIDKYLPRPHEPSTPKELRYVRGDEDQGLFHGYYAWFDIGEENDAFMSIKGYYFSDEKYVIGRMNSHRFLDLSDVILPVNFARIIKEGEIGDNKEGVLSPHLGDLGNTVKVLIKFKAGSLENPELFRKLDSLPNGWVYISHEMFGIVYHNQKMVSFWAMDTMMSFPGFQCDDKINPRWASHINNSCPPYSILDLDKSDISPFMNIPFEEVKVVAKIPLIKSSKNIVLS